MIFLIRSRPRRTMVGSTTLRWQALSPYQILGGALDSKDGRANGERFATWFDTHVSPSYPKRMDTGDPFLTSADCYLFRCSFLHQGRQQQTKGGYDRIIFFEPGPGGTMHMNIMQTGGHAVLNIDVRLFCREVVESARTWLAGVAGTEPYQTNLTAFVTRYPNGLAPYIVGLPLIA